jgi:hypothetical protein
MNLPKHPMSVDLTVDHEDGEMYGSPIPTEKKISSELIMPYLQRFFMLTLEELAYFRTEPAKLKADLQALARFVRFTCGIHASLAFSNEVDRYVRIPDDKLKEIAKEIFRDK